MKRLISLSAIVILLSTCVKDEVATRAYPRVLTGNVTEITAEGAHFHGEITFTPGPILDYGFTWGTSVQPRIEQDDKVSMGPRSDKGSFEAVITGKLISGKHYNLRAYAKSEKYVVYGNLVGFTSLGN